MEDHGALMPRFAEVQRQLFGLGSEVVFLAAGPGRAAVDTIVRGKVVGGAIRSRHLLDLEISNIIVRTSTLSESDALVLEPSKTAIFRFYRPSGLRFSNLIFRLTADPGRRRRMIDEFARRHPKTLQALFGVDLPTAGRDGWRIYSNEHQAAIEVVPETCPNCSHGTIDEGYFCGRCGYQCSVVLGHGGHIARKGIRSTLGDLVDICEGCQEAFLGNGSYCGRCGVRRDGKASLSRGIGKRIRVDLHDGRRRRAGTIEGLVHSVEYGRFRSGVWDSQIIIKIQDPKFIDADRHGEMPRGFIGHIMVHNVDAVAAALLAPGDEWIVTAGVEIRAACPTCSTEERNTPLVRTPFCGDCGTRVRMLGMGDLRPDRKRATTWTHHPCGQALDEKDQFCTSCGGSVPDHLRSSARTHRAARQRVRRFLS